MLTIRFAPDSPFGSFRYDCREGDAARGYLKLPPIMAPVKCTSQNTHPCSTHWTTARTARTHDLGPVRCATLTAIMNILALWYPRNPMCADWCLVPAIRCYLPPPSPPSLSAVHPPSTHRPSPPSISALHLPPPPPSLGALLPLSNNPDFDPLLDKLQTTLKFAGVSSRRDDSSVSLGRRYAPPPATFAGSGFTPFGLIFSNLVALSGCFWGWLRRWPFVETKVFALENWRCDATDLPIFSIVFACRPLICDT